MIITWTLVHGMCERLTMAFINMTVNINSIVINVLRIDSQFLAFRWKTLYLKSFHPKVLNRSDWICDCKKILSGYFDCEIQKIRALSTFWLFSARVVSLKINRDSQNPLLTFAAPIEISWFVFMFVDWLTNSVPWWLLKKFIFATKLEPIFVIWYYAQDLAVFRETLYNDIIFPRRLPWFQRIRNTFENLNFWLNQNL